MGEKKKNCTSSAVDSTYRFKEKTCRTANHVDLKANCARIGLLQNPPVDQLPIKLAINRGNRATPTYFWTHWHVTHILINPHDFPWISSFRLAFTFGQTFNDLWEVPERRFKSLRAVHLASTVRIAWVQWSIKISKKPAGQPTWW